MDSHSSLSFNRPGGPLSAVLATCWVLFTACEPAFPEAPGLPSQERSVIGGDGPLTVSAPGTVLNRYAVLAADVSAGATSLEVTNAADLDDADFGPLSLGDLLFIVQMQGASIDTSDSASYGAVTSLNGSGLHEFAVVLRVEGNTLHLACAGLVNSYSAAGRTQVVRVPQLSSLTIEDGASVVAQPWNGQRGGVVVLHVEGDTTISGTGAIDVSAQGFRAGARENSSMPSSQPVAIYRSDDPLLGAEKGESIAGSATVYAQLGGRYGRGAPANGGGGGNSHNAGGGGGANGNNANPWSGQGVMSGSVVGANAWQLDPGYVANGGMRTDSSGGGRGGYTFSSSNQDALTVGPGNSLWSGNNRLEVGGLGGRPLDNDPTSRLFLGGGGGAGDGNNNSGAAGGNGGGLVYLISTSVGGSGQIRANGGDAQNTTNTHNDAPGGGGGGGTVLVVSDALAGITVEANGGRGGNQLITNDEAEGPGGGGGGGYIALRGGTVTATANGGQSGTTSSAALTEFPVNGATFGAAGQVVSAPALSLPGLSCTPLDLGVTITNGQTTSTPGTTVSYTVTVTNAGPGAATNAPISVPLPANATGATWTCTASTGAACGAASGTGAIATTVSLPPGATVTFTFELDVSATATGTLEVTATASASAPDLDIDLANNSATDSDTLVGEADLSVVLSESADPAQPGNPLTYTVQVANDGPSQADNVTVTFPVPVGSTFSSAEGTGWSCQEAGGVVTCTHPGFPPGDAPPIAIVVVPTIESGTLDASVDVTSDTADPTLSNNSATATVTITVTTDDFERRVVGSGCGASGASGPSIALWGFLALGGLALRGRRGPRGSSSRGASALLSLVAVVALTASNTAWAQGSTAIDTQQFKPAPGKADVLGLHGPGVPGSMNWRAGLYFNYAHEPLVVINPRTDTLLQHLVRNQFGFDLMGAIGLGDRFELGAVLPLNLQQGEFEELPTGNLEQRWKGGLGDVRLVPKALLLDLENLRLGLAVPVVLPTGGATALRGQEGIGVQPRVIGSYTFEGGTRLLANVGFNVRSRQELLNLSVGNELSYGLGAALPFRLQEQQFTGLLSVTGAFGVGASGGTDEEEIPLEVQAGLQYHFSRNVLATLGLGRGLTLGYGMPSIRVFTGVSWTAEEEPRQIVRPQDMDGDGLLDDEDQCPTEPEDKDGFQDEDGCPDPDNDGDGIADTEDKCPLKPEDKDSFQDEDGCPDPDNDGDGIADTEDKCPLKPEDKDGFQDQDGCPDPDNDRDGIPDVADKCPLEPETINGVDDTDGCPDKGNTQVEVRGGKILILEKVHFATNKDKVLPRSFPLLQQVGAVLKANPQLRRIRIEGHTDSRGNDAFNQNLSQRRANNVRAYLIERAGIAAERLEAVGYGETRPVDTNKTAAGRENNRRVEFTILETREEGARTR